jgi:putative hydrolase of the HAD superfamily
MRIEAVLFDLDDTLTDWYGAVQRALGVVAREFVLRPDSVADVLLAMREHVAVRRHGLVVDRHHWRLADDYDPWRTALGDSDHASLVTAFRSALLAGLEMHEDVAVIAGLRQRHRVAMLSNNPYARTALEERGIAHLFEAVVMMEDPFRKPHPRAFAEARAAIGADEGTLVYVGDSLQNDIEGAHAAGLIPVWIDRFDDRHPLPDGAHRIGSLWELPLLLERLEAAGRSG